MLVMIQQGTGVIRLNENTMSVRSPAFLCLNQADQVKTLFSQGLYVQQVYFDHTAFQPYSQSGSGDSREDWQVLLHKKSVFELLPFFSSQMDKTLLFAEDGQFEKALEYVFLCQEELLSHRHARRPRPLRSKSYLTALLHCVDKTYYRYGDQLSLAQANGLNTHINLLDVLVHLNRYLSKSLTLHSVAAEFSTNRTDLERLFKEYLNETFYQYIANQRLERAMAMLHISNFSLNDVALRAGFSTTQNFCRFFRKKVDLSPSKYRKAVLFS